MESTTDISMVLNFKKEGIVVIFQEANFHKPCQTNNPKKERKKKTNVLTRPIWLGWL